MLVEWIAFFQLEPMPADRADWCSTWHTAHLLTALSASEDFEADEDFLRSLIPKHGMQPDAAEPHDPDDEARDLQATILAHFS